MWRILILLICTAALAGSACSSRKAAVGPKPSSLKIDSTEIADSLEYELIVTDPGYDTYLATLPYPKDYYSDGYYRSWNLQYVTEWNYRCSNPIQFGSIYEYPINYDPSVTYGLDFNYRLYHYFLFFEKTYHQVLIRRPAKQ